MVKNTGISGNQLSDLDFGQILKDSHDKSLHALDVNVINSLVPERYAKVSYELRDMLDGTFETEFVNFYDLGTKQISQVALRTNFLGTAEISIFSFIGVDPATLSAKYALIYDDVGSVGILFRLDGGATGTSGAARDIIVDIITGDTGTTLAQKTASAMDADSKFTGVDVSGLCQLTSSTVGNKTNATAGDSGLSAPLITAGTETLNNQYFNIFSANDLTEYYVWFNFNSTGTDPAVVGKTGIEIAFSNADTYAVLSQRVADTIGALDDFSAEFNECVFITNYQLGTATDSIDVSTGSTNTTTVAGSTGDLVARVQVFFNSSNIITSIERVV